jgi:hypothetical protein
MDFLRKIKTAIIPGTMAVSPTTFIKPNQIGDTKVEDFLPLFFRFERTV